MTLRESEDDVLVYPEEPTTWEQAVKDTAADRKRTDNNQWRLGWRANMIEARFGKEHLPKLCAEAGIKKQTLTKYKWVASRFTHEMVATYPGVPFTVWELVAPLASDDVEAALDLVEKYYETPGACIEDFEKILRDSDEDDESTTIPPLVMNGRFWYTDWVGDDGKEYIVIGFGTTQDVKGWRERIQEHPLYGREAQITVTTPEIPKV